MKKLTQDNFEQAVQEACPSILWDFSKTIFVNTRTKVVVRTQLGEEFSVKADQLLQGSIPRVFRQMSFIDFGIQSSRKFDYRFKYRQITEEFGKKVLVEVTCEEHGIFRISALNHLQSTTGCPDCGAKQLRCGAILTTEEFIEKAKKVHNGEYVYASTVYTGGRNKVKILCKVHGEFTQIASNHLSGGGCVECQRRKASEARLLSKDTVIASFIEAHGYKYDYSEVEYLGTYSRVKILCPIHGPFYQSPSTHKTGCGCHTCNRTGFDFSAKSTLYYLEVLDGKAYKIGITNRSVKERFTKTDLSKIRVMATWEFTNGLRCYKVEQELLKTFKEHRWRGAKLLKSGNTELFNRDVLSLYNKEFLWITQEKS